MSHRRSYALHSLPPWSSLYKGGFSYYSFSRGDRDIQGGKIEWEIPLVFSRTSEFAEVHEGVSVVDRKRSRVDGDSLPFGWKECWAVRRKCKMALFVTPNNLLFIHSSNKNMLCSISLEIHFIVCKQFNVSILKYVRLNSIFFNLMHWPRNVK